LGERLACVRGGNMYDLQKLAGEHWPGRFPSDMQALIELGPQGWRQMAGVLEAASEDTSAAVPAVERLTIRAPLPRPRKNIFCLGLNYAAHMEESAKARGRAIKIPEVPVFFTKAPTSITGPYDPILWDRSVTNEVDYEVELAVIIGVRGKNISREDAPRHVFGYTIVNDVSARDLQLRHFQWFKGKSLDGFCPMGPHIVTADEFGDPQSKQVSLLVNGVTKQSASTASMIFSIPIIIEYLSQGMTLEPGDIISTGTPEGVGLGRTPPEYLADGDLVEARVEGIGALRNRVVALSR
jgi:2-keto-4-pentenoate hydratase/2-oxohepta-3-ene-1,7-dioic acid hydratase in catechol pathway